MAYRLHLVNSGGAHDALEFPFSTVEAAMTTACTAIRHGATDAWIVDDNGQKVADFVAIQQHCASAPDEPLPDVVT